MSTHILRGPAHCASGPALAARWCVPHQSQIGLAQKNGRRERAATRRERPGTGGANRRSTDRALVARQEVGDVRRPRMAMRDCGDFAALRHLTGRSPLCADGPHAGVHALNHDSHSTCGRWRASSRRSSSIRPNDSLVRTDGQQPWSTAHLCVAASNHVHPVCELDDGVGLTLLQELQRPFGARLDSPLIGGDPENSDAGARDRKPASQSVLHGAHRGWQLHS